jgi:predicted FMN-binding regulatory protein PaiB
MTSPFERYSNEDVQHLLAAQPLAWIVSGEGATFRATLLPLRPITDASGAVHTLVGHFPVRHEHAALLRNAPRANVLVLGPNGYISPSWMQDRTQAPTWNYASLRFEVSIEFVPDEQALAAHLHDLVGAMEHGRARAWSIEEMGARYASLAQRIVMFRARVLATHGRFKLGQDERDDVFRDILTGAHDASPPELLEWMKRFNPQRGGS